MLLAMVLPPERLTLPLAEELRATLIIGAMAAAMKISPHSLRAHIR